MRSIEAVLVDITRFGDGKLNREKVSFWVFKVENHQRHNQVQRDLERERDGSDGIKEQQQQQQGKAIWDDVATGIWGSSAGGDGSAQDEREENLQHSHERQGSSARRPSAPLAERKTHDQRNENKN